MSSNDYSYEGEIVRKKIVNDERLSGRKMMEDRKIKVETGMINSAEGSALVTLGKTKVLVGIKAGVERPYPDSPNQGSISVNIEMSPMADPKFENGPPSENAVELSRVVDRCIRESKAIDFDSLCIVEGEKIWTIFVDIAVINNSGNLYDTCSIGALAALKTTKLPKLDDDYKIIKGEFNKKLKMEFEPLLFTFAKIADKVVLDPDLFEEAVAEARYSVAITETGNIVAIQKGIGSSFSIKELEDATDQAIKAYKGRIKQM